MSGVILFLFLTNEFGEDREQIFFYQTLNFLKVCLDVFRVLSKERSKSFSDSFDTQQFFYSFDMSQKNFSDHLPALKFDCFEVQSP